MSITFRHYVKPEDINLQYEFWQIVTKHLPYAWKPTLSPKLYQHQQEFHPKSRYFAYDDDKLVGYMSFTGQGDFVSLGYPWVLPEYEGSLQDQLYEQVYNFAASEAYGGKMFAQRFRSQWTKQIDYFLAKGFAITNRSPIVGVELNNINIQNQGVDFDYTIKDEFQFDNWVKIQHKNEAITSEQATMMGQYYSSVAFDFSLQAFRDDEQIGYFGVTIRADTGYAEILAVSIQKENVDTFTDMLHLILMECMKRGAKTVSVSKGSVPEEIITNSPLHILTEDVMVMKKL
jgi:hypothetical protein